MSVQKRTITRILDREHLISDGDGRFARKTVSLEADATEKYHPGTVLSKVAIGLTAVATASAGNTGNGAMGAVTVDAGAAPGTYTLTITDDGSDAGEFIVEHEDGGTVGAGVVGTAFDGPINFTLADGATDFAVGDSFAIVVSSTGETWQRLDLAATDGGQYAAGTLLDGRPPSATAQKAVVNYREPTIVNGKKLTWPDGISASDKAAEIERLHDLGIKVE